MTKCPECGKDIDYVHATITPPPDEADVEIQDGCVEWDYDQDPRNGEKHVQVTCPVCYKQLYSGNYMDAEAWIEDFLKGVE